MSTFDFRSTSVAALLEDLAAGRVSSRELVDATLANIEAHDGDLNAFVAVDAEAARAEADEVDRRRTAGHELGALAGIPLAVKDAEDAAGYRTTKGSWARRDAPVCAQDSVHVGRLREAGAVVVGKTNVPELGLRGETDNKLFGITRNPWNLERTPGGSSGGSAAALAAGVVPLATASDGGGSIRIPAAVTGLTGLKPTGGRVPMGDRIAPGWGHLATRGPLARTAADTALALDAVVGPHPRDMFSLPRPTEPWHPQVAGAGLPRRVAFTPDLGYANVDGEVAATVRAAVDHLADLGVEVVEIDGPFDASFPKAAGDLTSAWFGRTTTDLRASEDWRHVDPILMVFSELARARKDWEGVVVDALGTCHGAVVRLADLFEGVDLLLSPVTAAQTATCDSPQTVDSLLAIMAPVLAEQGIGDIDPTLFEELLGILRTREPFNVPLGMLDGQPVPDWHGMTQVFNMTRSPAGTVMAGTTRDGMPVGLQVIGPHLGDLQVLQALAAMEESFEVPASPPFAIGTSS